MYADAPLARNRWLPAVLLAGALALRLIGLDQESLWIDELGSYNAAAQPTWHEFVEYLRGHERTPALYYLLLRGWMALDTSVWWTRLLSALIGTAGIGAAALLAARSLGRATGLWTLALLAVLPYHLYYSQELRSYILQWAGATVASGGLACWLRAPAQRTGPLWFVAGTAIALGSGYLSALVYAAHLLLLTWFVWRGQMARRAALAGAGGALALGLPLFVWMLPAHLSTEGNFTPPPPSLQTPWLAVCHFVGGVILMAPNTLVVVGALAGLALFVWGAGDVETEPPPSRWRRSSDHALAVWILSALWPAALLYALSLYRPVMLNGERYLIISLGPAWVVAARGLAQLRPSRRAAALTALGLLWLPTLWNYYTAHQKLRWRDAAAHINARHTRGDVAVSVPLYNYEMLRFYLDPAVRAPQLPTGDEQAVQALAREAAAARAVWIVSIVLEPTTLDGALKQLGFVETERLPFRGYDKTLRLSCYRRGP